MKLDNIKALHLELTTKCNARCPMCVRNFRGSHHNSGYPLTELTLDNIQKIFNKTFLENIKVINFNGNLGDFGMASDAISIVNYFLDNCNAEIQIETNGSMRTPDWWEQLVSDRVIILWALDGIDDTTHQLYRIGADFDRALKNALAYISKGGNACWKFIPFKHNLDQQEQAGKMSQLLGFKEFIIYDQGRNTGPVYDKKGKFSHWLGEPDNLGSPSLEDQLKNHYSWFDPSTVIAKTGISEDCTLHCNHLESNEIYVAADGSVYPCCFLGFYPKTMHHPGNLQIKNLISKNNAIEYGLEQSIEWFDQLYKSWQKPTVASGKPFICLQTCGRCDK
jgi:MoaA/NifB/PqqE/SkfB family radical SAM enzyme